MSSQINWKSIACPFHDDYKNSASISEAGFICYVNCTDGKVIPLSQYFKQLEDLKIGDREIIEDETVPEVKLIDLPLELKIERKILKDFLVKRKIQKWVYEELAIDFNNGYITLWNDMYPDEFTARAYVKEVSPQHNHSEGSKHMFGLSRLQNNKYCFLVEGLFDYLTLYQLKYNVVFYGGVNVKPEMLFEISDNVNHCFILFDNDYAGFKGSKRCKETFDELGFSSSIIRLPRIFGKDCNVALQLKREMQLQSFLDNHIEEFISDNDSLLVNRFISENQTLLKIPTGIEQLDKLLNGGYTQGVNGITGLTSSGKTSLACYLCNIFSGVFERKGLYCSYELSKLQIWSRLLSFHSKHNWNEIEVCPAMIEDHLKKNLDNLKIIENIKVVTGASIFTIKKLLDTDVFDYVIIDYLQRMPRYGAFENRVSISENTKILGDIARDKNKIIILLSTLPKSEYGSEDSEYKESGDIKYILQTSARIDKQSSDITSLNFDKNTRGMVGNILLRMDLGHQKYYDLKRMNENEITSKL